MKIYLFILLAACFWSCSNSTTKDASKEEYKEYYKNRGLKIKVGLKDGKPHGRSYIYDSSGNLILTNFFYYGLRTGPGQNFKDGSITDYYFYSLESQEIYHLDYDSIGTKGLLEVNNKFFHISSASMNDSTLEFRIYNICPTKYKCNYNLIIADSLQHFKKLLYHFNDDSIWHTAIINTSYQLEKNEYYAIKIDVIDSVNHKDCVMQKFLRW